MNSNENWDEIDKSISPLWSETKEYFFLDEPKPTQSQRVVFCAIMLYLEKNDIFDIVYFKQWMRIVWNIVENTDIADWSSAIGVMKLIAELSDNSTKIYEYLANPQFTTKSDSSKIAIAEEKQKCSFIYSNDEFCDAWEIAFIEAESHPFFKGAVNFLVSENMQLDEFKHRTELAKKVFDEKGVNEKYRKEGHIFLRALISQYTEFKQIKEKYFTDTDEREHYLKKMLATDEVIQKATREWFSLNDENDLINKLKEEVHKESQIISWEWEPDNLDNQRWLKKVHEDLYKNPDLQDWMQETRAIRLNWYSEQLYISRPRAWYYWMLLGSYRNEIISKLLLKPYNCSTGNQCRAKRDGNTILLGKRRNSTHS